MTNQKIKELSRTEKATITLTGIVSLPLRIGERAMVRASSQTFLTSRVIQILEISTYGIVFETCNTIYNLTNTPVSDHREVMCA